MVFFRRALYLDQAEGEFDNFAALNKRCFLRDKRRRFLLNHGLQFGRGLIVFDGKCHSAVNKMVSLKLDQFCSTVWLLDLLRVTKWSVNRFISLQKLS